MSSFRRKKLPVNGNDGTEMRQSGVKTWINGALGVISTGHKQLDDLLGGGFALGTMMFVETDSFSDYGSSLVRYNIAESLSHNQSTFISAIDATEKDVILSSLPLNLNYLKKENELKTVQGRELKSEEKIVESSDVSNQSKNSNTNELKIAWQYEKYLQTEDENQTKKIISDGTKLPFCCSYDLSRCLQSEFINSDTVNIRVFSFNHELTSELGQLLIDIQTFIKTTLEKNTSTIIRIILPDFENFFNFSNSSNNIHAIGQFFLKLKHFIRDYKIAVLLSIHPETISRQIKTVLSQIFDTHISIDSFAGKNHSIPYEFQEFSGFLTIRKIQQYGMLAPFRCPASRFGLKRDRRKLHIEPLHLPPEESRAFGSAGSDPPKNLTTLQNPLNTDTEVTHQPEQKVIGYEENPSNIENNREVEELKGLKLTPLSASIAAMRAARQQQKEKSGLIDQNPTNDLRYESSSLNLPTPVSISSSVSKSSSSFKKKSNEKSALQLGASCQPSSKANYDF